MGDDQHTLRATTPATRVRFRVVATGCSMALLTYIHRQSFVAATPEIMSDLDLNQEQMGYVASAFLLAYGLFQMPCGAISDRFGARHLLTVLVLGWSILTGLTALVGSFSTSATSIFALLLAARFLFGACQAGAFPVWSRVMTDWLPLSERASGQGAVWMCSRIGGAIGPLLFLALYSFLGTWKTPLWLLGLLGVVWCAGFWILFRDRPEQVASLNTAERELIARARDAHTADADRGHSSALFTSLNVWALCAMYGCVGFAGNFTTNLLPMYLAEDRHLSPGTVKALTSLPLVFGVVSCIAGGLLSDWIIRRWHSRKWGRRINGCLGLGLAGLTILTIPWVQPVWLLALLFSASFFFNDLNIAPAWAACADVGERYAGTISGAMNMTGQFGGVVGMALAGWLLHRGHVTLLFILFACSYGLAAGCWLAVDVTRPLRLPQLDRSSGPSQR